MTVRRSVTVGAVAVGGVVALLLLALAVLWFVQRDRTLPNTSVAGIDVSRMTADEVRAAITPTVTSREGDPVVFTFEGETYPVEPDDVGYHVDAGATVAAALSRGRTGFPGEVAERLRSLRTARDVDLIEAFDEDLVTGWVDTVADEIDRDEFPGLVEADPDSLEVEVRMPHGRAEVRRADTAVALVDALLLGDGRNDLELPVDTTPQPVSDEAVEAVADQVRGAIDQPLVLNGSGTSLTLEPVRIAELIEVVETTGGGDTSLDLVVTPDAVEEVIGDAGRRFDVSPTEASYVVNRTPPQTFDDQGSTTWSPVAADVGIEGGDDGARFDPELAAEQLTELLRDGAREAELRLEVVEPELSRERAEELGPTHLLGTFTTYYQAGQTRNHNIQRLADVIDGAVVLPGEQFSINEISGERTCEKGYEPAGTIIRGELVDTCGGGTSQFGTTTFNAAFFSAVQLDQWKAHSWYISRYPMGREATLSYPQLDVKFTNTTDGIVIVKTAHSATSVTVSVYGQPIAEQVSATHGSPTNPRSPTTEVRTTSSLPAGQERVIQAGGSDGFTVEVERTVERTDGSAGNQTIRTVYLPQNRIVERGTG